MGCLGSLISLIISMFKTFILIIGYIIIFLTTLIVSIIKHIRKSRKEKQAKENKYVIPNDYQYKDYKNYKNNPNNIKKEITNNNKKESDNKNKNITNSYSYLKIYINKKYTGLRKDNQLNYKLLQIEPINSPYIYYDDFAEVKGYNVFETDECSSLQYGYVLEKIYAHCNNDFYATIGYEENEIIYNIKIKDNNICINEIDEVTIKNKYNNLKNKIISFSEILSEYYLNTNNYDLYYSIVPNDELDCDSIIDLSDKLKETEDLLLFEMPYMEETSLIIDIIEPTIKKEIEKYEEEINSLSIFGEYNEDEEESIYEEPSKPKKKELSWKEQEFEREAELWGLSEYDKKIAKEERMTPAEYIEAEEYDDDELLLDEWER